MENKRALFFWVVVILAGVGLISYSYFFRPGDGTVTPTAGPDLTVSPILDQSPTSSPRPNMKETEEPFLGLRGITSPATCQISGEANFSSPDSFSSNTKISWQNVDSQGRLIKWHISPKDDLAIGPNLFANLIIPNGQYDNFTIRLPEKPVAKAYLVTASVTYGQIIKGDVKVKEVNCTGQVKVNLNF